MEADCGEGKEGCTYSEACFFIYFGTESSIETIFCDTSVNSDSDPNVLFFKNTKEYFNLLCILYTEMGNSIDFFKNQSTVVMARIMNFFLHRSAALPTSTTR